jgi:hypothetical protein
MTETFIQTITKQLKKTDSLDEMRNHIDELCWEYETNYQLLNEIDFDIDLISGLPQDFDRVKLTPRNLFTFILLTGLDEHVGLDKLELKGFYPHRNYFYNFIDPTHCYIVATTHIATIQVKLPIFNNDYIDMYMNDFEDACAEHNMNVKRAISETCGEEDGKVRIYKKSKLYQQFYPNNK